MAPILIGVLPFALVAGAAGVQNGLSLVQTAAFSVFAFAGAAQITAAQLIGAGSPLSVVTVTAVIINLRFLLYSADLSRLLPVRSALGRAGLAYVITDHAYAVTERRARTDRASLTAFYAGAALAFWFTWQVGNLVGSGIGSRMASDTALTFAVPLSFLGLLVPTLNSSPRGVACVAAAVVAVLAGGAPAGSGVLLGIVAGLLCGFLFSRARGASRAGDGDVRP